MPLKAFHQLYAGSRLGDSWENSSIDSGVLTWWILSWLQAIVEVNLPSSISSVDESSGVLVVFGIYCFVSIISVYLFSKFIRETTIKQNSFPDGFPRHTI